MCSFCVGSPSCKKFTHSANGSSVTSQCNSVNKLGIHSMQQEINFIVLACTLFTLRYYAQAYIVYIIMYERKGRGGGGENARGKTIVETVSTSL